MEPHFGKVSWFREVAKEVRWEPIWLFCFGGIWATYEIVSLGEIQPRAQLQGIIVSWLREYEGATKPNYIRFCGWMGLPEVGVGLALLTESTKKLE